MHPAEFTITSRRVVTDEGVGPAWIHVQSGQIAGVSRTPFAEPGALLDFGDHVVMPGIVDTHVHVNEPGRTEWEGFRSAGRAAAAGGTTTMVVMPLNCTPAATTARALRAEADAARGKCLVDYALWGGLVEGNACELEEMWRAGAVGFKCFLTDSGVDDFAKVTRQDLDAAAPILGQLGAVLLAHAEDPDVIAAARENSKLDQIPRSYAAYVASRPPEAELASIRVLIDTARSMQASHRRRGRLHIVHVSTAEALPLIAQAKREGLTITCETCPHYLTLASEDIADGRTEFKCAPPIRERANQERLWAGLKSGVIDLIASDHSPCPPELKLPDTGDFAAAWGGISSLQLSLPLVWTSAARHGFGFSDVARWFCAAPAMLAGIEGFKGSIRAGHDADLVVWDPEARFVVDAAALEHRHKVTPYHGMELHGVVQSTFVRGRQVFGADGFATESNGRWVKRQRA